MCLFCNAEAVLAAVRKVLFPVHHFFVEIEGRSPPTEAQLASAIAAALKLDRAAVRVELDDNSDDSDSLTDDLDGHVHSDACNHDHDHGHGHDDDGGHSHAHSHEHGAPHSHSH
jgi:hypothetical protein